MLGQSRRHAIIAALWTIDVNCSVALHFSKPCGTS
jgi:hypothetical protein